MTSTPFLRGGLQGWRHGPAGAFHTYDAFDGRPVHLLLPPGYRDDGPPRRLLLMHDGDAVFWPGGAFRKCWRVPEVLAALGDAVDTPIVVAVPPRDRAWEYTHADWAAGTRPWGGLPAYTTWLADRLVPWVRAHYRVAEERCVVAGSSHGGLAALFNAVARPDVFGGAAAMSPSVWVEVDGWETEAPERPLGEGSLLRLAAPVLEARAVRLWLCWGLVREGGFHNHRTEALATKRGRELAALCAGWGYRRQDLDDDVLPDPAADLFVWEDRHGAHDEEAWSRRLPTMLRAFFGRAAGAVLADLDAPYSATQTLAAQENEQSCPATGTLTPPASL